MARLISKVKHYILVYIFQFYTWHLSDITQVVLKLSFYVPAISSFFPFPPAGKGSSSISSDISSSTDHTPTKAPKNVATTEGKASGAH